MKEQVLRILSMVQEGRLSPEDAYELMDAFVNFEENAAGEKQAETETAKSENGAAQEPFRKFVDSIEKMTKEAIQSVDWGQVATKVRTATKRGAETLKESVEHISRGEFKFPWLGPSEEKTVELPLSITAGKTLRLERTNGNVKVLGGYDLGKVIVTAKVRGRDREDARKRAETWTPVIEENEGSVVLRQSADVLEEHVEVQIPTGTPLDIRIESGDVRIKDTRSSLRLEAKSGDIDAEDLTGSVEITSYAGEVKLRNVEASLCEIENKSGDVRLSQVRGNMSIRSASGDIQARDVAGNAVSIESVSGDIDMDFAEPISGAVNVRTVSGDVLLDIASGSNCRVSLSSLNGSVSSRVDLSDEKQAEERITGMLGTGEGALDASAVSGDVRLAWREHG